MEQQRTCLLFCAHPDDEILGAGGTIAKYQQEGMRVICVIFSKGEKSHPWMQERHVHDIRTQESLVAGSIVGVSNTIFLGLRDGKLSADVKKGEILARIKAIIEHYQPEKIFTHDLDDCLYKDHIAVHTVVLKAVDALGDKFSGNVYTFNIWFMNFRKVDVPRLLVDISSTFHKKRKALRAFESQKVALFQLIPLVYAKAFMDGIDMDVRFAESFHKIR